MQLLKNVAQDFRRNKIIYLFCIPIILWYVIFCYAPMGGGVMAFQNFNPAKGIAGSPFVGLRHFVRFFNGPYAWRLIRNTFTLSLLDLCFNFPAPIIFALLLNEISSKRYKKTIQTVSYMPYFISLVVMCGIIVDFTKSGGLISRWGSQRRSCHSPQRCHAGVLSPGERRDCSSQSCCAKSCPANPDPLSYI